MIKSEWQSVQCGFGRVYLCVVTSSTVLRVLVWEVKGLALFSVRGNSYCISATHRGCFRGTETMHHSMQQI
jgi:hypothetical protein